MSKVAPFRRETTDHAGAQQIVQRAGGRFMADRSTQGEWIYYSGRQRVWIVVRPSGARRIVEFYRACPCGG